MLPDVDFDSAPAVADFVQGRIRAALSRREPDGLAGLRLFSDVEALFAGRTPAFAPIDLNYHNLRHTLMATVCMALILEGRQFARTATGRAGARDFELAIAGGAPARLGLPEAEERHEGHRRQVHLLPHPAQLRLRGLLPARSSAPPTSRSRTSSRPSTAPGPIPRSAAFASADPVSRVVGCALATADYLGQLADPHYPDKLGELYARVLRVRRLRQRPRRAAHLQVRGGPGLPHAGLLAPAS